MRKDLSATIAASEAGPRERDLAHLWHPYTQMQEYGDRGLLISRAAGTRVWDEGGREYLDGMSGLWNVNLGHNRPEIVEAVAAQLRRLDYYPLNGFSHLPAIDLAAALSACAPQGLEHVFFCTGGAEATETALKMSRQYWRLAGQPARHRVISLSGAWHGGTLGALSAAGIPEERSEFGPLLEGFEQAPSPAAPRAAERLRELLLRIGPQRVCAILLEPVQGAGGIVVPPDDYVATVRALTREFGCHLILDEVATGFGRTGAMFAAEHAGVTPDFLLCAKALTNGCIPLAAVLATDEVYEMFLGDEASGRELMHGYTFGGHPVACAAGVATLRVMRDHDVVAGARAGGERLLALLRERLKSCELVADVRGVGMMLGVEIRAEARAGRAPDTAEACAKAVGFEARARGLIVRGIGRVIPVMPPLVLTDAEMDELVDKLHGAVRAVEERRC